MDAPRSSVRSRSVSATPSRRCVSHWRLLGSEIWERALVLSRQHSARLGTRTLDLLHVAAALVLGPDVFYTFDKRQRKLGKTQRLRILPRRALPALVRCSRTRLDHSCESCSKLLRLIRRFRRDPALYTVAQARGPHRVFWVKPADRR